MWLRLIFSISLFLPHLVLAQTPSPSPVPAEEPLTGQEGRGVSSTGADSNAGAEGPDSGAISLSKGGIAAIIAVVVVVALLGGKRSRKHKCSRGSDADALPVGSVVLYIIAKRRQWKVRESIRRASRRITGRSDGAKTQRQSKRGAVRVEQPRSSKAADLEKGTVETKVEAKSWKSKLSRPTR
jgi:hypothetical protein